MKPFTNGGFGWAGCSSSGVDFVVSSHTQPCEHFTGCTKKKKQKTTTKKTKNKKTQQQTEGGRKKQTCTDLELQNSGGEV